MDHSSLILSCSPRRGNSDAVARLLAEELARLRPDASFHVERLADHTFRPCTACGYCDSHAGRCSLDTADDEARGLLEALCRPALLPFHLLVSPVYFYHLPAQLKALMDRSQRWWNTEAKPGRGTALGVVLLGARPKGDKLFAGSLLSLKYMALTAGLELLPPLLLYGLDAPDAFSRQDRAQAAVRDFARALLSRYGGA